MSLVLSFVFFIVKMKKARCIQVDVSDFMLLHGANPVYLDEQELSPCPLQEAKCEGTILDVRGVLLHAW